MDQGLQLPHQAAPSVFRQGLPVLLTTFVNKIGAVGLSILPMLLVERQLSAEQSSLVMGLVKAALLAGTFAGGWLTDRTGMRGALLLSFLLAAVGLGLLPFAESLVLVAALAIIAQLGNAMFHSPSRLMITALVPAESQREAIGWLRSAVNAGQIVSFSIAAGFAALGVGGLLLFDSATSLFAAAVGWLLLPKYVTAARSRASRETDAGAGASRLRPWLACALLLFGFAFLFETFMVGAAARFKLLFGTEGLSLFSQLMVVNTVLCAVLSVFAARRLTDPGLSFSLGVVLVGLGNALVLSGTSSRPLLYTGAFVLTAGEIAFAALAQFTMMRVTPPGPRQGTLYSVALVIQACGRILGASLAFPLVVHGAHAVKLIAAVTVLLLGLSVASAPMLRRHGT